MKILIIKMSSMGDVIHTLPSITDLCQAFPTVEIDWVVEEGFAEIPAFHPAVTRVLPVAIRRWRQGWWRSRQEILDFRSVLRSRVYDVVIDAQGLLKSALVAGMTRGETAGFDRHSAREPLAASWYDKRISVPRDQHAVLRLRQLFAAALDYPLPSGNVDYGLTGKSNAASNRIMFIHGTTWASKHWPEVNWVLLGQLARSAGFGVCLPAVGEAERARATRIAAQVPEAEVLPQGSLKDLMAEMKHCRGVVSVDTGPGHLATALNLPLVGLYGATDPSLTGFKGPRQAVLVSDNLPCSPCLKRTCQYAEPEENGSIYPPCYQPLSPERVLETLRAQITQSNGQHS